MDYGPTINGVPNNIGVNGDRADTSTDVGGGGECILKGRGGRCDDEGCKVKACVRGRGGVDDAACVVGSGGCAVVGGRYVVVGGGCTVVGGDGINIVDQRLLASIFLLAMESPLGCKGYMEHDSA
ncbi:conserved hypothetical protein [Ricinus communis]|uniref:Uncharacterized protein n=1 Tax=Ricinus communis TaxID=3988 RepID=B9T1H1_RICCO|nr:conserved hypothetical protein [Ricinus communis]